ncbi:early boundary activity protein 2-like [Drosophila novamexicana]|uniref:early boundary activity protein 2-like n=1 Tax=Drosophila novamexicana TaxID=47314 RepID=UPI0011E5A50D|nr:early boundary activity protein 2-like [Drosophila novamexicana]
MAHFHNFGNKNGNAEGIYMPVHDSAETWPEQARAAAYTNPSLNIQPNNLLPVVPFTHSPYSYPYQQFLSHFAPNLVPYYYSLLTPAPIDYGLNFGYQQRAVPAEMDIDKYINSELSKQQSLLRKQNVRPRPLSQLQLPSNRQLVAVKKEPQQRRVINVQVVAMSGSTRDRTPDVEPLPPVEASFKERVAKINKSQQHYTQLFDRLTSMLQTLNRRYDGNEMEPEPEAELEEAPPPPLKRARHDMSSSSSESHLDPENSSSLSIYPQRIQLKDGSSEYVLGPHGTRINAKDYGQVFWTSAPVATRCLLAAVFSSDELATHTLTGKPSPAFYGRERPAKKMLDQNRVDDIVVSVRNRTGGKERHIRATITTKCADTAKKYKRRAKKALKDDVVVIDE